MPAFRLVIINRINLNRENRIMVRIAVQFVFLIWAVTAEQEEFQQYENVRLASPKHSALKLFASETSQSDSASEFQRILPQQNAITSGATETNSRENETFQPNQDPAILIRKIEACRGNHPSMSNKTFNLELYGSLLGELLGVKNDAFKDALRRCNISQQLVDKLKAELSKLDIFQEIFVVIPKNNSPGSLDYEKSTQQPTPLASNVYPPKTVQSTPVENNLKLKLGDEWIPLEPKVSHVSHIYLGSSIYPMLTEESRVLDKDHTIPSPTSTETLSMKNESLKSAIPGFVSAAERTRTEKFLGLTPLEIVRKTPSRFTRHIERKSPESLESFSETSRTRDYVGESIHAPHRLSVVPRKTYRWKTAESNSHRMEAGCPLDMKQFSEDPRYQLLYKLCSSVLSHFKKFLKLETWKNKFNNSD